MEKLYGYKKEDAVALIEYLKVNNQKNLSKVFLEFAKEKNKSKGTIRNLYYAIAKRGVEDKDFCDKYLGGEPLKINKITAFEEKEEKELIQKILIERERGRSVRSVINELANGDIKLALRYQNKFRTAIKKEPSKIKEISKRIRRQNGYDYIGIEVPIKEKTFLDGAINLLKEKIDSLVDKICLSIRKENEVLKERIALLEEENQKYKKIIYEKNLAETTIKGFLEHNKSNILS